MLFIWLPLAIYSVLSSSSGAAPQWKVCCEDDCIFFFAFAAQDDQPAPSRKRAKASWICQSSGCVNMIDPRFKPECICLSHAMETFSEEELAIFRCHHNGCKNLASGKGDSALSKNHCTSHGGDTDDRRCGFEGCNSFRRLGGAFPGNCMRHGGGLRCKIDGCYRVVHPGKYSSLLLCKTHSQEEQADQQSDVHPAPSPSETLTAPEDVVDCAELDADASVDSASSASGSTTASQGKDDERCTTEGCSNQCNPLFDGFNLCPTHARKTLTKEQLQPFICTAEGCVSLKRSRGITDSERSLCQRHRLAYALSNDALHSDSSHVPDEDGMCQKLLLCNSHDKASTVDKSLSALVDDCDNSVDNEEKANDDQVNFKSKKVGRRFSSTVPAFPDNVQGLEGTHSLEGQHEATSRPQKAKKPLSTCTAPDCTRRIANGKLSNLRLCLKHANERIAEDPEYASLRGPRERKCRIEGCTKYFSNRFIAQRMCHKHAVETLPEEQLAPLKCAAPGCKKLMTGRGATKEARHLCIRHGGGNRCTTKGCNDYAAITGPIRDKCRYHGGGLRCTAEGCTWFVGGGEYLKMRLCNIHGSKRLKRPFDNLYQSPINSNRSTPITQRPTASADRPEGLVIDGLNPSLETPAQTISSFLSTGESAVVV